MRPLRTPSPTEKSLYVAIDALLWRGDGLDDGAARLGQLYGKPDATFQASPSDPAFWWYRSAGLIIGPAYEADYRLAQFVVLRPGLPADQARRFILAQ